MNANSISEEDILSVLAHRLPWEQLRGATVLVTGAGGLLASAMVDTLMHLGTEVLAKPVTVLAMVRNAGRARGSRHGRGIPPCRFSSRMCARP
jgi:hypothetical protein